jgi:hypothetical protein
MEPDMRLLKNLLNMRGDEIEAAVEGTGYLAKTVIGVGTFLLDNQGDLDLLSSRQRGTYDRFLKPLLDNAVR